MAWHRVSFRGTAWKEVAPRGAVPRQAPVWAARRQRAVQCSAVLGLEEECCPGALSVQGNAAEAAAHSRPVLVPLACPLQAVAVGIVGGSDLTKIQEQLGPNSESPRPGAVSASSNPQGNRERNMCAAFELERALKA